MDASGLSYLLAGERRRFVRLARRRLPTEADAEELVQRCMMRAAERAGSLEDPARAGAWFGRIVQRAIGDFYKSPRIEVTADGMPMEVAAEMPEVRSLCPCSVRLLDALRPAYADILRRVDLAGQSPEAVATALALSSSNVHVRLHRARRALRRRVEEHCGVSTCGPCLDCTCGKSHCCGDERADG